jgi:hypothetical protein
MIRSRIPIIVNNFTEFYREQKRREKTLRYKEERQKQRNNIINLSRLATEFKKDDNASAIDDFEENLPLNSVAEEMELNKSIKPVIPIEASIKKNNTNSNIIVLS